MGKLLGRSWFSLSFLSFKWEAAADWTKGVLLCEEKLPREHGLLWGFKKHPEILAVFSSVFKSLKKYSIYWIWSAVLYSGGSHEL